MLTYLSIRNIVLIEALDLDCGAGLIALTGETGAGKSILLDALGLALGMRAETGLVRAGEEKAEVAASFALTDKDAHIFRFFEKQDIALQPGEEIILRRSLTADGRSKAFINDRPVSIGLLKEAGARLVEVHGQFETHGLLHVKTHRRVLDRFGGHESLLQETAAAWDGWQAAAEKLKNARAGLEKSKEEQDYLQHLLDELEKLSPEAEEEDRLMEKRSLLANREKLGEAFTQCRQILAEEDGAEDLVARAQTVLDRVGDVSHEGIVNAAGALERAAAEIAEALGQLETLGSGFDDEEMSLDMIEERLFALRDCARKHGCAIGALPQKQEEIAAQLELIEHEDEALARLEKDEKAAREIYAAAAKKLSEARQETAARLEKELLAELPLLKLEKVKFVAEIAVLEDVAEWGMEGMDRVRFLVATNPGQQPEPLQKVASGGELSRLMLAFKVVMAGKSRIPCLIFDEIDSGIGGAVADAVGAHLKRLSKHHQVLVVTHSPQVAAKADAHWVISKTQDEKTVTEVNILDGTDQRREEIARMLSGQDITEEARAAAAKLIGSLAA
jgi:DNA repair protein RecN (Recombination protein N)